MAHLWTLVLVYGIGFNYHIGQIQHNHNSITYIVLSNYDHTSIVILTMIKKVEWCNANGNGYRRDIIVYIYTYY